jgi:hypothetical protein
MTAINSNSASVATPDTGAFPGSGPGPTPGPGPGSTSARGKGIAPILPPLIDDSFAPASWKAVYTIVERGINKRHFVRIGVAFVNRDGSLNVRLDAVPVNGQLHIRDAPPRDGRDSSDAFLVDRDRERERERERGRNREVIAPF